MRNSYVEKNKQSVLLKLLLLPMLLFLSVIMESCEPADNDDSTNVNIYVAGFENNANGKSIAKYWKNGTAVDLSDSTNSSSAASIYVSGNDVYVAGRDGHHAVYWKNSDAFVLSDWDSSAHDIYVSNNDVYVAGSYRVHATYWKTVLRLI